MAKNVLVVMEAGYYLECLEEDLAKLNFDLSLKKVNTFDEFSQLLDSNENFSSIILDYSSSHENSATWLEKIGSTMIDRSPKVPIFLVSTVSQMTLQKAKSFGAASLYFKPFQFVTLLQDIAAL